MYTYVVPVAIIYIYIRSTNIIHIQIKYICMEYYDSRCATTLLLLCVEWMDSLSLSLFLSLPLSLLLLLAAALPWSRGPHSISCYSLLAALFTAKVYYCLLLSLLLWCKETQHPFLSLSDVFGLWTPCKQRTACTTRDGMSNRFQTVQDSSRTAHTQRPSSFPKINKYIVICMPVRILCTRGTFLFCRHRHGPLPSPARALVLRG